jgi:hypothetical protein
MADEADSKSVAGNRVRVQVPLPAVNIYRSSCIAMYSNIGAFIFNISRKSAKIKMTQGVLTTRHL